MLSLNLFVPLIKRLCWIKAPKMSTNMFIIFIIITIMNKAVESRDDVACAKRVYLSRAEQMDDNGLKCWDNIKVPSCGGRCDSREISDWEFPFKKSHHPVCAYGSRRPVIVRLRHCDEGVTPGTDVFHFVAAEDCRCKVCSSQFTSCEWLPPNSTLLEGVIDNEFHD